MLEYIMKSGYTKEEVQKYLQMSEKELEKESYQLNRLLFLTEKIKLCRDIKNLIEKQNFKDENNT